MPSLSEFLRSRGIRLHPFFINHQIYAAAGFWYNDTPKKWKNVLYGFYRTCVFFSITITAINQILDIYLLLDKPTQLATDLCAITVTIMVFCKVNMLSYKSHMTEKLQEDIMRIRLSRNSPEDEEVWNSASSMIYTMTKVFYAMGAPCVLCWIFFPALDGLSRKLLPYPVVFPVNPHESPFYELIYIGQSLSLFGYLFSIVSIDLSYCAYVVLAIAQMEILGRDIKRISSGSEIVEADSDTEEEKTKKVVQDLKKCIDFHNEILRQLDAVHDIHSDSFFIQMSLTALMIAVVIVDTILNSSGLSLKLFQRVLYTACGLFDTWIQCYWGSQLQQKSYDLVADIYDSQWVDMETKVKKIFLFMTMKAQKVPRLRNGIFDFGLPLFLEILRYSYNAAALIMNT
ncbi:UNVERIFIED_CONTAM: hypothetical protein PYX00_003963 [Menopon gallinae]|uniref:Odorant receptor n=1 Tax=Menopon gallinae TaxID=328185 RepID=A0AAW2I2U8_9NEOP